MTLRVAELIPDDGFLRAYVDYAERMVIGTPEIHLFCGLSAVSTLTSPAVKFYLGEQWRHPHIWTVIISRAGAGKSAPLGVARRLVAGVLEDALWPTDFSREAMLEAAQANPYGLLEVDEFGGFLARLGKDYMGGAKQDLSRLYDSPERYVRVTRSGGRIEVRDPAFTILGAAPADDLARYATTTDFRQGFLTRFLFIPQQSDTSYVGLVQPDDGARSHLTSYARELVRLRQDVRPFHPTPKWAAQWEAYDRTHRKTAETTLPELAGFYGRAGLHTYKLALLLTAAKTGDHPTSDREELARANQIITTVLDAVTELLNGEVGLTPLHRERRDAYQKGYETWRAAGANGWVNWSAWLRTCRWLEARKLREWAEGWHDAGLLELRSLPTKGRAATQFRFTPDAADPETLRAASFPSGKEAREISPSFPERSPHANTQSEPDTTVTNQGEGTKE